MAASHTSNRIQPQGSGRSIEAGDMPDNVLRRYYLDHRGGAGIGLYTDARVRSPAFRDQGRRLIASRTDPTAIRDMTAVAQHRGWSTIKVQGSTTFKREAWLAGVAAGLEVTGYRPSERDLQEVAKKRARARSTDASRDQLSEDKRRGVGRLDLARTPSMRVLETIVRTRVASRLAQERMLEKARDRLASWLERGARLAPLDIPCERPGLRTVLDPERRR